MIIEKTLPAFSVIGKEGSTKNNPSIVSLLWEDANGHFTEVADLAKKDELGRLSHVWGLMSDLSRSLLPWEEHYSLGLYLAGVEVDKDAIPPEGWVKWDIPERTYLIMEIKEEGYQATFQDGIYFQIPFRRFTLCGAVCDYTDVITQKNYLYFPVEKKPITVFEESKVTQIAACGNHCAYCFFKPDCPGCQFDSHPCSFGYYCEDKVCPNLACSHELGLEGCYECDQLTTCKKGFFEKQNSAKECAIFIQNEGKEAFEIVIKEMIHQGFNYSKDLEERAPEERLAWLYSLRENSKKSN